MSYTDGMTQNPDGGYTGSVGISLSQQQIEQGEYTGGMLNTLEANEIISTATAITQMGATNLLASNNLKLLMESESIKATLKGAEMVKDSNILLSKVITNMATSLNESFNNSLMVDSIILGELQSQTEAINNLIQTIKDKQIEFNANSISMGNLSFDTSSIVKSLDEMTKNQTLANSKIIEGVESQKITNQKIIEKINADLDKNVEFEGKMYNKTELQNLSNVEKIKNLKDENEFALNDGLEMVEDFMINDGFTLDFNPFEYLLKEVEDGLKDEFSQIKTKYNINIGEI